MKTQTKKPEKKYVPYGMNGMYYVYDTEAGQIPYGYGHKYGTKTQIKSICNRLNQRP